MCDSFMSCMSRPTSENGPVTGVYGVSSRVLNANNVVVEADYVLYLILVVSHSLRPSLPPSVGMTFFLFVASRPQMARARETAFTTTVVVLSETMLSPMVFLTRCFSSFSRNQMYINIHICSFMIDTSNETLPC